MNLAETFEELASEGKWTDAMKCLKQIPDLAENQALLARIEDLVIGLINERRTHPRNLSWAAGLASLLGTEKSLEYLQIISQTAHTMGQFSLANWAAIKCINIDTQALEDRELPEHYITQAKHVLRLVVLSIPSFEGKIPSHREKARAFDALARKYPTLAKSLRTHLDPDAVAQHLVSRAESRNPLTRP